jgi:hypothetical protein
LSCGRFIAVVKFFQLAQKAPAGSPPATMAAPRGATALTPEAAAAFGALKPLVGRMLQSLLAFVEGAAGGGAPALSAGSGAPPSPPASARPPADAAPLRALAHFLLDFAARGGTVGASALLPSVDYVFLPLVYALPREPLSHRAAAAAAAAARGAPPPPLPPPDRLVEVALGVAGALALAVTPAAFAGEGAGAVGGAGAGGAGAPSPPSRLQSLLERAALVLTDSVEGAAAGRGRDGGRGEEVATLACDVIACLLAPVGGLAHGPPSLEGGAAHLEGGGGGSSSSSSAAPFGAAALATDIARILELDGLPRDSEAAAEGGSDVAAAPDAGVGARERFAWAPRLPAFDAHLPPLLDSPAAAGHIISLLLAIATLDWVTYAGAPRGGAVAAGGGVAGRGTAAPFGRATRVAALRALAAVAAALATPPGGPEEGAGVGGAAKAEGRPGAHRLTPFLPGILGGLLQLLVPPAARGGGAAGESGGGAPHSRLSAAACDTLALVLRLTCADGVRAS